MAHKLSPFFEIKLGETFTRTLTTGERDSCDVFAREYRLLLTVVKARVEFHVSSRDLYPSGHYAGGTDQEQGTVRIGLGGKETLEDVLNAAVQMADPEIFKTYPEAEVA